MTERSARKTAGGLPAAVARIGAAIAIAALAGGCQGVGDAYKGVSDVYQRAYQSAYQSAYRNAYQTAYRNAYQGVYTLLFGRPKPPPATPASVAPSLAADRIVVLKSQRRLELELHNKIVKTYPIALGPDALGRKRRLGDGRTPEGEYTIDWKSADTRFTGELHISYPDAADRAWADEHHVDPGGEIFIHGMPRDYGPYDPPVWLRDWTEGCIAVGNAAIDTIYTAVPDGTPVDILP
jgi:lipoprotein-anchoring transpeptidase ErfK/SrfK